MTYWNVNPHYRYSSRIEQHQLNTDNESRGMAGAESAVFDRTSGWNANQDQSDQLGKFVLSWIHIRYIIFVFLSFLLLYIYDEWGWRLPCASNFLRIVYGHFLRYINDELMEKEEYMLILQAPQCHWLALSVDSKSEGLPYHNSASG